MKQEAAAVMKTLEDPANKYRMLSKNLKTKAQHNPNATKLSIAIHVCRFQPLKRPWLYTSRSKTIKYKPNNRIWNEYLYQGLLKTTVWILTHPHTYKMTFWRKTLSFLVFLKIASVYTLAKEEVAFWNTIARKPTAACEVHKLEGSMISVLNSVIANWFNSTNFAYCDMIVCYVMIQAN